MKLHCVFVTPMVFRIICCKPIYKQLMEERCSLLSIVLLLLWFLFVFLIVTCQMSPVHLWTNQHDERCCMSPWKGQSGAGFGWRLCFKLWSLLLTNTDLICCFFFKKIFFHCHLRNYFISWVPWNKAGLLFFHMIKHN